MSLKGKGFGKVGAIPACEAGVALRVGDFTHPVNFGAADGEDER